MKKIESFIAEAPKLKSGTIEYCLWASKEGPLYIQILRNITETTNPGTHSKLLFCVSELLLQFNDKGSLKDLHGLNPETFDEEKSSNDNDSYFLKAILNHLIPNNIQKI